MLIQEASSSACSRLSEQTCRPILAAWRLVLCGRQRQGLAPPSAALRRSRRRLPQRLAQHLRHDQLGARHQCRPEILHWSSLVCGARCMPIWILGRAAWRGCSTGSRPNVNSGSIQLLRSALHCSAIEVPRAMRRRVVWTPIVPWIHVAMRHMVPSQIQQYSFSQGSPPPQKSAASVLAIPPSTGVC